MSKNERDFSCSCNGGRVVNGLISDPPVPLFPRWSKGVSLNGAVPPPSSRFSSGRRAHIVPFQEAETEGGLGSHTKGSLPATQQLVPQTWRRASHPPTLQMGDGGTARGPRFR